jgi:hypothetical protein
MSDQLSRRSSNHTLLYKCHIDTYTQKYTLPRYLKLLEKNIRCFWCVRKTIHSHREVKILTQISYSPCSECLFLLYFYC